jgi:hypothetical protein
MAKEHKYDRLDLSSTVYVPYRLAGSPERILAPAVDVAKEWACGASRVLRAR